MTALLHEFSVLIVESHAVFPPEGGEPRRFDITTSISGNKSDLAAIYDRVDVVLKALNETIVPTMTEGELVSNNVTYSTPQLDQWHKTRLESRPLLPPRYL
jgi:hypothetical protein